MNGREARCSDSSISSKWSRRMDHASATAMERRASTVSFRNQVGYRVMRVLVVDDDAVIRKVLVRVLEQLGHETVAMDNGDKAWELLKQESFPIVVLDWMMRGLDGLDLCRRIRTTPGGERSVIMMVTGRDQPTDLQQVLEAGADDYLMKPLNLTQLFTRLRIASRTAESITERIKLQQKVLQITAEEQFRLGRELHDGLGQVLTGIAFLSSALNRRLASAGRPEAADAAQIEGLVTKAVCQTRHIANGLVPVEFSAGGLSAALSELARSIQSVFHIQCAYVCDDGMTIEDGSVALEIFRIAQESTHNAVKHSGSDQITIEFRRGGDTVDLSVTDRGRGIRPEDISNGGSGILIMKHRARLIGATLEIQSSDTAGTQVMCRVNPRGRSLGALQ